MYEQLSMLLPCRIEGSNDYVVVIVDPEDYPNLVGLKWKVKSWNSPGYKPYVMKYHRSGYLSYGEKALHGFLLDSSKGIMIDHINGDTLDNRKSNLRVADSSGNKANSKKQVGTSSIYKGVSFAKRSKLWYASIKFDGRSRNLGYFKDEIEAAKAYDRAARELFGEFAKPNFSGV